MGCISSWGPILFFHSIPSPINLLAIATFGVCFSCTLPSVWMPAQHSSSSSYLTVWRRRRRCCCCLFTSLCSAAKLPTKCHLLHLHISHVVLCIPMPPYVDSLRRIHHSCTASCHTCMSLRASKKEKIRESACCIVDILIAIGIEEGIGCLGGEMWHAVDGLLLNR